MKTRNLIIGTLVFLFLLVCAFLFGVVAYIFIGGTNSDQIFGGNVAVVKIEGVIMDVDQKLRQLDEVYKNDDVKAVIVRLNSPGGAIGASQELFYSIKRLSGKKPVVASMATVAASGAYYASCGATKIVANPGTITGSIGVISKHVDLSKLIEWAMIGYENFTAGKHKDMYDFARPMTDEEKALMYGLLAELHEQFKNDVATSRKIEKAKVDEFATGRVMSGEEALKLGLVDELGNLDKAIEVAAGLAGIKDEPKVMYLEKRRMGLLDLLGEKIGGVIEQKIQSLLTINSVGMFYLSR